VRRPGRPRSPDFHREGGRDDDGDRLPRDRAGDRADGHGADRAGRRPRAARHAKQLVNPVAALGTIVAIGFTVACGARTATTFGTSFVVNDYAVVFKLLFLGSLLAILGISWRFFAEGRYFQGEYYFLLLTAFIGMLIMPSARDLILLFVAVETVSIPAFVMAGMRKRDLYSSEAALKFFLIGVLSVALMLFGMSLVYGFTGTTDLAGIAAAIAAPAACHRCCSAG
jgi:NADH-quinone oxidoreductase subunit N